MMRDGPIAGPVIDVGLLWTHAHSGSTISSCMTSSDRYEVLAVFGHIRPGWSEIVERLDRRLSALDPRYDLVQVKQKLGGLRYYIQTDHRELLDEMEMAVLDAERHAERTCEQCGDGGVLHRSARGWLCTLCSECARARNQGYTVAPRRECCTPTA